MTEGNEPRLFADDEAIRHIGEGLLACSLAKPEWTHEAHLAACLWLIVERPDVDPERDLRGLISRFNESVGGINDDTQGYHHSITLCFVRAVRHYLAGTEPALPLVAKVNGLLAAPEGRRERPLGFYTPERLFSVEARRGWVEPDLRAFESAAEGSPVRSG